MPPPFSEMGAYTCADKVCVAPCFGNYISISVTTDEYPEETRWTLTNTCTGQVGDYSGEPATTFMYKICVADASFEFVIPDYWVTTQLRIQSRIMVLRLHLVEILVILRQQSLVLLFVNAQRLTLAMVVPMDSNAYYSYCVKS